MPTFDAGRTSPLAVSELSRSFAAAGLNAHYEEALEAENAALRDLLKQAGVDAAALLKQAGLTAAKGHAAERLQRLLFEELHHRVKNTLATVISITSQSLGNALNLTEGRLAVEGRLFALARAQDMLLEAHRGSAKLIDVIRAAIEPFDSSDHRRILLQITPVEIGPRTVLPLAMSLNELCTNAVKYGALSDNTGSVDITSMIDEKTLCYILTWTERDGPAVQKPTRSGFGSRLISRLAKQIQGVVELKYQPSGLVYKLEVPLDSLRPVSSNV
jgi:two-component sensor histidine kinase